MQPVQQIQPNKTHLGSALNITVFLLPINLSRNHELLWTAMIALGTDTFLHWNYNHRLNSQQVRVTLLHLAWYAFLSYMDSTPHQLTPFFRWRIFADQTIVNCISSGQFYVNGRFGLPHSEQGVRRMDRLFRLRLLWIIGCLCLFGYLPA